MECLGGFEPQRPLPVPNLHHVTQDLSIAFHDLFLNAVYVLATFELKLLVFFERDPSAMVTSTWYAYPLMVAEASRPLIGVQAVCLSAICERLD